MPNPRYLKKRNKPNHFNAVHNHLEFSEELTQNHLDFTNMQPVPQPKDYDEIEY